MKKSHVLATLLILAFVVPAAHGAPPIYREKEYYGPIPWNSFSVSVGFFDGGNIDNLTDYLTKYAKDHQGTDNFGTLSIRPYVRLNYDRQLTPNHFVRVSTSFTYVDASSIGNLNLTLPSADTLANYHLDIERSFKAYLFSLEGGFMYYFVSPEVQRFSPYVGAGLGAVMPVVRLKTDAFQSGEPFSGADGNFSKTSVQAAAHVEFGMNYYITNRYAAAIEGRYELTQSTLHVYRGNIDLNLAGFMLTLTLAYLL
jgi:opacity protein-like surface antigen